MLILRSDSLNSYGIFQPAEKERQIKKTEHNFDVTIKPPGEDKTHLGQEILVLIMSLNTNNNKKKSNLTPIYI